MINNSLLNMIVIFMRVLLYRDLCVRAFGDVWADVLMGYLTGFYCYCVRMRVRVKGRGVGYCGEECGFCHAFCFLDCAVVGLHEDGSLVIRIITETLIIPHHVP